MLSVIKGLNSRCLSRFAALLLSWPASAVKHTSTIMGIDDEAMLRNIRVYCASSRFFSVPAIPGYYIAPRSWSCSCADGQFQGWPSSHTGVLSCLVTTRASVFLPVTRKQIQLTFTHQRCRWRRRPVKVFPDKVWRPSC